MFVYCTVVSEIYLLSSVNARYGVMGTPTLLLFHNGNGVGRYNASEYSVAQLMSFIKHYTDQDLTDINVTSSDFRVSLTHTHTQGKYNIWVKNRTEKQGGGVMLLVKKNLVAYEEKNDYGLAEVVVVKVVCRGGIRRDFVVAYVPPKTNSWNKEEYKRKMEDTKRWIEHLMETKCKLVMMGDFNSKEVKWEEWTVNGSEDSWSGELLRMAMENSMTQWVKEKTRYRGEDEPSRLDLIITKEAELIENMKYGCPIGKSDHVMIECVLGEGRMERRDEHYRTGRLNYGKADFTKLRNYFEQVDWSAFEDASDIEDKWKEFVNIYEEGINKYVPRVKKEQKKIQAWFNKRCEESKRKRDTAWNKWMKRKGPFAWEEYKKARNEYTKIRREEARKYEKNIVEKCKNEPKLFYRFVNGKLKNKKEISKLKVNGEFLEDEELMAEELNKCFQKVFTNEETFNEPDMEMTEEEGLDEIEVLEEEVCEMLERLDIRKAQGPDGVSNWVLRECKAQLANKICGLISKSLQQGQVPKDWKRANIVPIFKSGSKEDPTNYRPVSLTSVVAKLCESAIKKRWNDYLERKEILTNGQFGFRKGKSCATNLLCYYSRVIDVVQEREGWVDGIYLDLKKAFDKVPHKRLLWKLKEHGGLRGKLLQWISDFLTGREMRTVIRGKKSAWREVTSGVPQGSVLAPLLFAVYINDMMKGVSSYMSLFADDAKLMRKITKREDCEALQRDLDKIWEWSREWQMEFNIKKCGVMNFGKSSMRPVYKYRMGDEKVETKTEERDLGITVTERLLPEAHIKRISGETYNLVRNIRTAFCYLDEEMVKKLIVTMIRPRLEYAALIWSPNMMKDKRKLERVQRAATKLPQTLMNLSYDQRLEKLSLPTLEKRRERGDLIAMYRILSGIEKLDRDDIVVRDRRSVRKHGKKVKMSVCNKDIKKYSFPQRIVGTWNGLEKEIVEAKTIHCFKEKLDKSRYRDGTARV